MPTKKKAQQNRDLPKILIFVGMIVLVAVLLLFKNQSAPSATAGQESLETQFDLHIKAGKPVFAFFHSTTCYSCIVMMETVAQVYPEFKDSVALIDVDVNDAQNENLLRRAGIRSIPTQVFIDRKGGGKTSIGVMDAAQLRQQLQSLKGTP